MWAKLVAVATRLRSVLSRRRIDDEMRNEFNAHLDLLVERYLRMGMTREKAIVAAQRQFGNALLVREQIYRMNTIGSSTSTSRARSPRRRCGSS